MTGGDITESIPKGNPLQNPVSENSASLFHGKPPVPGKFLHPCPHDAVEYIQLLTERTDEILLLICGLPEHMIYIADAHILPAQFPQQVIQQIGGIGTTGKCDENPSLHHSSFKFKGKTPERSRGIIYPPLL